MGEERFDFAADSNFRQLCDEVASHARHVRLPQEIRYFASIVLSGPVKVLQHLQAMYHRWALKFRSVK